MKQALFAFMSVMTVGCATAGPASSSAGDGRTKLVIQRAGIFASVTVPPGWKEDKLDPAKRPGDANRCARLKYSGDPDAEIFITCGFPERVQSLGIASFIAEVKARNLPDSAERKTGITSFSFTEPTGDARVASFTFDFEQVKPASVERMNARKTRGVTEAKPESMYEIVTGKVTVKRIGRSPNDIYIFEGGWKRELNAQLIHDFDALVNSLASPAANDKPLSQ